MSLLHPIPGNILIVISSNLFKPLIKLFLALFQPFNLANQNVVFGLLIQSRILHMYEGTSFTDTIFIMQPFHIIPNERDVFVDKNP